MDPFPVLASRPKVNQKIAGIWKTASLTNPDWEEIERKKKLFVKNENNSAPQFFKTFKSRSIKFIQFLGLKSKLRWERTCLASTKTCVQSPEPV